MRRIVDGYVVVALFAPLVLVVCAMRTKLDDQVALLDIGWGWQGLLLFTLIMPILALRRLRILRASSDAPSLME